MAISNPGGNLNSVPAPQKQTLDSNYIDFTSADTKGWAQQYLPDLMEAEAEVFGPRTISGFLSQVGAEESMTADQVIWSEQSRLHISVKGTLNTGTSIFTVTSDIDGNAGSAPDFVVANHGVRLNDIVLVAVAGRVLKAHVTKVDGIAITAQPYSVENFDDDASISAVSAAAATLLVVGSEFKKGVSGQGSYGSGTGSARTVKPTHKSFTNKPIIMKDVYEISGSDASQVGWVEITGEAGQSGYLWYLKAEGETRSRFTDYLEMTMMEAEKTASASHIVDAGGTNDTDYAALGANSGTEGLFAAIEDRGNVTTGVTGVNAATDLAEFDAILAEFDNQGAIEENMLFVSNQ